LYYKKMVSPAAWPYKIAPADLLPPGSGIGPVITNTAEFVFKFISPFVVSGASEIRFGMLTSVTELPVFSSSGDGYSLVVTGSDPNVAGKVAFSGQVGAGKITFAVGNDSENPLLVVEGDIVGGPAKSEVFVGLAKLLVPDATLTK
jgi:hypothetical protein